MTVAKVDTLPGPAFEIDLSEFFEVSSLPESQPEAQNAQPPAPVSVTSTD
jgi:hypothetical protein